MEEQMMRSSVHPAGRINANYGRSNIYLMWNIGTQVNGPIIIVPDFLSLIPYHAVLGFFIPLLLTVLEVSIQGTTKPMFETHPGNLWTFLVAILVYCVSFVAEIRSKFHGCTSNSKLFNAIAIISGSLCSVSAISMIPRLPGGNIIFIIWTIVPLIIIYQHSKDGYNWLHQKISGIRDTFTGSYSLREQPPIHPRSTAEMMEIV